MTPAAVQKSVQKVFSVAVSTRLSTDTADFVEHV